MSKLRVKQHGFATLEIVLMGVALSLIIFVGWYVVRSKNAANNSYENSSKSEYTPKPLTPKELSEKIENAPAATNSDTTNTENNTNSSAPGQSLQQTNTNKNAFFRAQFDGFSFSYPNAYSKTIWSDASDSTGITVSAPKGAVYISYGAPVETQKIACNNSTPKLNIASVETLSNNNTPRQTYLITYSYEYEKELIKGAAVTDWEGSTPKTGMTDKCNYSPYFQSKNNNAAAWFRMSDTSDSNRSKTVSVEDFFGSDIGKATLEVLRSGKY